MTEPNKPADGAARIRLMVEDGELVVPAATAPVERAAAPSPRPSPGVVPEARSSRDERGSAPTPAATKTAPPKDGDTTAADVLPPGCPVIPLGVHGDVLWFLNTMGAIQPIQTAKLSRLNAIGLFAKRLPWLYEFYDKKKKVIDGDTGEVTWVKTGKLRYDELCEDLIAACAHAGVWDPGDRIRGGGAWIDGTTLMLHCGNGVLAVGADGAEQWFGCGQLGNYVYPRMGNVPPPLGGGLAGGEQSPDGPAERLAAKLRTWHWKRGEDDVRAAAGLIGAQMMGGALEWRPQGWVTGDTSTGKSTFQKLLDGVHGPGGSKFSSDASAAGLWQAVQFSSLPVRVDELEASQDNRRAEAIVKLARQASSGGVVLRGGDRHESHSFTARNCFLFSSMRIPPLLPQDRNRITVLDLLPLKEHPGRKGGAVIAAPSLEEAELQAIGAGLRRRLVKGWPQFRATLETFKATLAELGHDSRGQDQLGTILACAWILHYDEMPEVNDLQEWTKNLGAAQLADGDAPRTAWAACLDHIVSTPIEGAKGEQRQPVSYWLERGAYGTEAGDDFTGLHRVANKVLGAYGLKVVFRKGEGASAPWLAVRCAGNASALLFKGSQWDGMAGAATVWSQDLTRVPGHVVMSIRIAGESKRCVLIPFALFDPEPPKWAANRAAPDDEGAEAPQRYAGYVVTPPGPRGRGE